MKNKALFTSDTNEHYTPTWLLEWIQNYIGEKFQYDPCGNHNSPISKIIKVVNDISRGGEDGLLVDWTDKGTVFQNPPYGRDICNWIKKGYESSLNTKNKIVALIPARTDTKYFHEYIFGKAQVIFLKGRIKFYDCEGHEQSVAPFPSAVVIWNAGNKKITYTDKHKKFYKEEGE